MGGGKTSWAINELLNGDPSINYLYVTPFLEEIERVKSNASRQIVSPINKGAGKIGNIAELLKNQKDIAATHELFRRFNDECKAALTENKYTLILDETITAVEPYFFDHKDDYSYLIDNQDIRVNDDGLIEWIGDKQIDTRFNDVRTLTENKSLFRVDDKFFLWHYPVEVFSLFDQVYIMTYLFPGSLMKYYFDLYQIDYETKSISQIDGEYQLVDYYAPNKKPYRNRIDVYEGTLTKNICQKPTMMSSRWCQSRYNQSELNQIKRNVYNYCRNIIDAPSDKIMWSSFKNVKRFFSGKGYARGFVPCNARATNDYRDRTCLVYLINWYENPEIVKFFHERDIKIDQDAIALSTMIQWLWRSNIRVSDSNDKINIYIPSKRMRELLKSWLNDDDNKTDDGAAHRLESYSFCV